MRSDWPLSGHYFLVMTGHYEIFRCSMALSSNLIPRSLEDEAEGEIWPNPICITWSPVRNVTGEVSAHAQHIRSSWGSQGRSCRVQQAYDRSTTWLTNIRSNLWISLLSWNQTSTKWGPKVLSTTWPHLFQILLRQSENFGDFCKVLSQFAFRNMIVPFYTSSSARARSSSPPSHTQVFWRKKFYIILPLLRIVIAKSR